MYHSEGTHTKEKDGIETMLGDPKRAISIMFVPLAVSYLVIQINLFVDTIWCSGLGSMASSAVSSMAPIYWIIADVGTGFGIGASAAIARRLGAGDRAKAESMCSQIIAFSAVISIAITPIMFLVMGPTIEWIGAGDISDLCMEYITPMIAMTFFLILNGIVAGTIRAEGAARRSMIVLLTAAILNMVLEPLFIYVLGLGLFGAGLATGLSTAVATLMGLHWYMTRQMNLKISFRKFRFKLEELKDMLYVGIPKVTETTMVNVMSLIQRIFVIACAGTVGVALYNIPWRFVAMGMVPAMAIGAALIPVCSAAMGQGNFEKAKSGFGYAVKLSLKILLPIMVIVFIFADWLIIPFTYSESMMELRPQFVETLRIYSLIIPFVGMVEIGSSILQSLRLAQLSLISSFLRNLMIVIFFAYASTISMTAISWSLLAAEFIGGMGMILWAYYEIGKRERSTIGAAA